MTSLTPAWMTQCWSSSPWMWQSHRSIKHSAIALPYPQIARRRSIPYRNVPQPPATQNPDLSPSFHIPVWVIQPAPCRIQRLRHLYKRTSELRNCQCQVGWGWSGLVIQGEGLGILCVPFNYFISFIVLLLQTLPYWLGRLLTDIYLTDIYLLTLVFEFRDMIMWTWQQIICNCIDCCNLKICNIS